MLGDDWLGDGAIKPKSKRKSKGAAHVLDEPIDDTFDAMLDSASKSASRAASSKQKSARRSNAETASGWSNDIENDDDDDNNGGNAKPPPVIRRSTRRPTDEIIATDIPTISMDEADGDDAIDMNPQIAVAPEFSVHQLASFKEIENEYSRERASKYIDPKIDIGILYNNLHLQEEFDNEDHKPWDWDKIFVEIRNAVTNPTQD